MAKKPRETVDLTNPIFHDEEAAREHLERLLWPAGPVCPHCGVVDQATLMKGKTTRPGLYKCRACRKPFTVTMRTVMERSHIPLSKWVLAAQLMASSKKSMSAHQLHRMINTNYETAWFLFHRLREAADGIGSAGPLGGKNEVIGSNPAMMWHAMRKRPNPRLLPLERAAFEVVTQCRGLSSGGTGRARRLVAMSSQKGE